MATEGPFHDMMQSVHEVAEESRRTNTLLRDIKEVLGDPCDRPT
jgi:hypothetical protein